MMQAASQANLEIDNESLNIMSPDKTTDLQTELQYTPAGRQGEYEEAEDDRSVANPLDKTTGGIDF